MAAAFFFIRFLVRKKLFDLGVFAVAMISMTMTQSAANIVVAVATIALFTGYALFTAKKWKTITGIMLAARVGAAFTAEHALQCGYRGIDSAQMYRNERECGQSILSWLNDEDTRASGIRREDIFFTSKLASNSSYDAARRSIKQSVKACGLGYIDLFLLHSPYGGKTARLASWRAVEDAIDAVRTAGVDEVGLLTNKREAPGAAGGQ